MAIHFLYRYEVDTKSTRKDTKRHEKTRKDMKSPVSTWEFFLDSSLLYFHTGLKYLVPAQAIIIGFRSVLVPSQAVLCHVSCRPGLSWTGTDQPDVYHTFNPFLCRHEIDTKRHEIDTKSTRKVLCRLESCRLEKWHEKVWPQWKITSHISCKKNSFSSD